MLTWNGLAARTFAAIGFGSLEEDPEALAVGDMSGLAELCTGASDGTNIVTVVFPRAIAGNELPDAASGNVNDGPGERVGAFILVIRHAIAV